MVATDPRAYEGLEPSFRNQVERWIAAGNGAYWLERGAGWRSHQRQIELRTINGCPDVWTAPASSCRVPTAIPGTSRHEVGAAVDISGNKALAKQNAARFGLTDIPREDWHFQAIGGRNPTRAESAAYRPGENKPELFPNGVGKPGYEDYFRDKFDDDCLFRLPGIGAFGVSVGDVCLLNRSQARGLLGGVALGSGVLVMLIGVGLLVGTQFLDRTPVGRLTNRATPRPLPTPTVQPVPTT